MHITVRITGLNLERLLHKAALSGLRLSCVRRLETGKICVRLPAVHKGRLAQLCEQAGWEMEEIQAGWMTRAARRMRSRRMLVLGAVCCVAFVGLSSQMILGIRIDNAQESEAEVRRFLRERGVAIGRFKQAFSTDALRSELTLRLPGLAFASFRYEGSTLVADCQPAVEGEQIRLSGSGRDVVALEDGIVTRLYAQQGTPQVEPGDAVHRGQVLIAGYEQTEKGGRIDVIAQGEVSARVFAQGEARVGLNGLRTVETGRIRQRKAIVTPWYRREILSCSDFASQDADRQQYPVVGLYLPLVLEVETLAETEVFSERKNETEAIQLAQAAALEMAKKHCPFDALILDKWTDYSMIDNEFVYAAAVLEYETGIAGRIVQADQTDGHGSE